jgi:hypothetical protein
MRVGRFLLVSVLVAGCSAAPNALPPNVLAGDTSRGSVRIQLVDTSQDNVVSTHVRANQVSVAYADAATGTRVINIGGWIDKGGGSFSKSWMLLLDLYGEPTAGKVFPLDTLDAGHASGAPDTASILFQGESADWTASSGSVTVQSLVSLRATFSLDAVTLLPLDATGMVTMEGTITMNGTVTIANINNVCDFCID